MLARIQSLYLVLVVIFAGLNLKLLPFWSFELNAPENAAMAKNMALIGLSEFGTSGQFIAMVWGFNVFLLTTMMLAAVSIALFSNRKIQIKVITSAGIATLLTVGFGAATAITFTGQMDGAAGLPNIGFYLLLVCLPLEWLAVSAIQKDEKIANAYKRL